MGCGEPFENDREEEIDRENGFDLEDRILCPDGTCTGIIIDGKCSECGKPHEGTESQES
jgi:hypothetical protein